MNNKIAWFFIIFVLLGSCLGIAGFCIGVANADNQPGFYQISSNQNFDVIFDFSSPISLGVQTYNGYGSNAPFGSYVFSSSGNTVSVSTQSYNPVTSSAISVYTYSFTVIPSDYLIFHFVWDPAPQNGWRIKLSVDSLKFNTNPSSDTYSQYDFTELNIGNIIGNPALNNRDRYLYILPFVGSVQSISPVVATFPDAVQLYPSGKYIVSQPQVTDSIISYIIDNVDPAILDGAIQDQLEQSYQNGYTDGKTFGYSQGVNAAGEFTFMGLIDSLFFAPLKFLSSLLNFDFFGVNLLGLFTGLITIVIIVTIVRIFI